MKTLKNLEIKHAFSVRGKIIFSLKLVIENTQKNRHVRLHDPLRNYIMSN